jgi:cytochrome P450
MEYDPYSYELDEDPYPIYRWLRDEHPIYHHQKLDFWAVTRFEDCWNAYTDFETFSSARGTVLEIMDSGFDAGSLIIFMDPPRQTRMRNLVSKAFTPRRIAELEPKIRQIASDYLDPLAEKGSCDIVQEFTAKLPMDVISTLLGIPPSDRDMVREWSNAVMHRDQGNPNFTERGLRAMEELMAYFDAAIAERHRQPRDDIMTLLIQAEVREEDGSRHRLTDEDLRAFFNLLATAGNETVTKLLATIFHLMFQYPDQRKRLLEDPGLIPNAVEETLRFDPPSQYQGRTLTRDVEIHGVTVPKDAKFLILNAASGRDERKYPDPDVWDVARRFDLHLNFGYGRHVCLGKNLALLESRIATEEFLKRFPDYHIPAGGITRMHSSNVRGLSGLQLVT